MNFVPKNTDVYKLLVEASLVNQVDKSNQNCSVMKTFFRIAHFMITKNWVYTHIFQDVVKLISDCEGNKVKTHLISSPKNTIYTFPQYIAKFIYIIDDYIKLPLLASLKEKHFTFSAMKHKM